MFESMAVSSCSASLLMGDVKYFIQSGFIAWRARHTRACGGEEQIVALERKLRSVRTAAKTEDAVVTLKTRAAIKTLDQALEKSRAERCEESLTLEKKVCGPMQSEP